MSYKIEQWHSYLYPNEVFPVPILFIKDDDDLKVDYNTKIELSVKDTDNIYTNVSEGVLLKDLVKGHRAIILASNWFGYPDENGKIQINKMLSEKLDKTYNNKESLYYKEYEQDKEELIYNKYDIKLFIQIILVIMIIYLVTKLFENS